MEAGAIFDWVTAHGAHGLALLVVAQLYLQGVELKNQRKELAAHRKGIAAHLDEEIRGREAMVDLSKSVVEIGTAVAVLLERDRDRGVREVVRDHISGVHEVPVVVDQSAFEDLAGDDTPVEVPPPKKPRARSHPGGAYFVVAGDRDKKNGGK